MGLENDFATLNINIDTSDKAPLYRQLATQIRQLIESKRLEPGERLPSSRKLAEFLGLSRTSTLNAYNQLIAEGVLLSRPASGVFVTTLCIATDPKTADAGVESFHSLSPVLNDTHISAEVFDNGPDVAQFPFADWASSLRRVWRKPDPSLLREFPPGGYAPLRQAVARYIKAVRDITCYPEQVIITAGNRDALTLIAKAMSLAGERAALENPCYPPLRHGLVSQGAEVGYCSIDKQGMTLPDFDARLAWITAARQYPLGVAMSTERRLAWLEYSRQHSCWLVEDDYDAEFQYHKTPLPPLFNLSSKLYPQNQQLVIVVGSFSKLFFRTLRIGYMIVPESLIEPFMNAQIQLGNLASVPIQPALADFIGNRRFAGHLRRMRKCYQQRRDFLYKLLREKLGDLLTVELPDGGMHLLVRINSVRFDQSDTWLEQELSTLGIRAPALSKHYADKGEQGFLLGFSGASEESLERGVGQLEKLLRRR